MLTSEIDLAALRQDLLLMQQTIGQDIPMGKKFHCVDRRHGDENASANLYEKDGAIRYRCFGCGLDQDVIGMRMLLAEETFPQAVAYLSNGNGGTPQEPRSVLPDGNPCPKPDRSTTGTTGTGFSSLEELSAAVAKSGAIESVYHYNSESADHLIVFRVKQKFSKTFRQCRREGGRYYFGAPMKPYSIYRRDLISTAETVIVCEGEKCADAINGLQIPGIAATTSPGGAKNAKGADWSVLSGKKLILWPDNDEPGQGYVRDVLDCLRALPTPPREILEIDPAALALSEKEDVYDYLQSGRSLEDALAVAEPIQEPAKEPGLKVYTLHEYIKLELPPKEKILDPILDRASLSMVHAWRGIGKTFFAMSLAHSVSVGEPFLCWNVPKARRTLYFESEMKGGDIQERLCHIAYASDKTTRDNFLILPGDQQDGPLPNLADRKGQQAIDQHLDGVEFFVIDNLSTLSRGGPENDSESWNEIGGWLLSLRKRGIAVMLIHHSGKAGLQRGTSKREDTLDVVINLQRPKEYRPEHGCKFEVVFEKCRSISGADAGGIEATLEIDQGRALWTWRTLTSRLIDQVRELDEEGLTQRQIQKELRIGLGTVNRYLKLVKGKDTE